VSMQIAEAAGDTFKQALASFASGVTVITVWDGEGRPYGMTANAFSSVSVDPLTVLICLNRNSRTYSDVCARGRFGVNILQRSAIEISTYCSRPGIDKHLLPEWINPPQADQQPPVLADALAYLDCSVETEMHAGTHAVILGQVGAVGLVEHGDVAPLLYFRGRYHELKAMESLTA
jgi:flavin reductase (DIM6/NTAB) family NADH-FMN oxidoreductase RutF